jgi:hypothetical protein
MQDHWQPDPGGENHCDPHGAGIRTTFHIADHEIELIFTYIIFFRVEFFTTLKILRALAQRPEFI